MDSNQFIGLTQAARSLGAMGRGGTEVHPATLTKWIRGGCATPAGRVKLRAVRVGAKWATTNDWVHEFIAAVTAASIPAEATPVRSPTARQKASERAVAELEKLGV